MPRYRIHMINSEYQSDEEGEYPSLNAARRTAIDTAIRIAAESIAKGEPTAAVEINIEEDGRPVLHHVVNLSVSGLLRKA